MLATSTVNPHHQGKKTIIILVVEMCAAVSKVTAGRCCHLKRWGEHPLPPEKAQNTAMTCTDNARKR